MYFITIQTVLLQNGLTTKKAPFHNYTNSASHVFQFSSSNQISRVHSSLGNSVLASDNTTLNKLISSIHVHTHDISQVKRIKIVDYSFSFSKQSKCNFSRKTT